MNYQLAPESHANAGFMAYNLIVTVTFMDPLGISAPQPQVWAHTLGRQSLRVRVLSQ